MATDSNINIQQNSERQLEQLAAYSLFYQRAKLCMGIQFALAVPAALVMAVIIMKWPEAKGWTTLYALTIAILDVLIFDAIQSHYKKLGARTQELFDSQLLDIEWNFLRAGPKPESEDVLQAAIKFKKKSKLDRLRDWYPPVVGVLPMPLARLICQRANTWWDSTLRKKYAYALTGMLIVIIIAVLAIAFAADNTVEEMILSVYAPIAPAVLWSIREIRRQREAAEKLDRVKAHVELTWNDALAGRLNAESLVKNSREIQDSIFNGRAHNPLIFDWINRLVRPAQQIGMNAKAQDFVEEAKRSPAYASFSV